jgi:hypothetical protein
MLFLPVKMMKSTKGTLEAGRCMPLNRAALLHSASEEAVRGGKAVTVLTYLHGVAEVQKALKDINAQVGTCTRRVCFPSSPLTVSSWSLWCLDWVVYGGGAEGAQGHQRAGAVAMHCLLCLFFCHEA